MFKSIKKWWTRKWEFVADKEFKAVVQNLLLGEYTRTVVLELYRSNYGEYKIETSFNQVYEIYTEEYLIRKYFQEYIK